MNVTATLFGQMITLLSLWFIKRTMGATNQSYGR